MALRMELLLSASRMSLLAMIFHGMPGSWQEGGTAPAEVAPV